MYLTLSYSILQGIKSFAQKFNGRPQYPFPDMTLLGQAKRLQTESKNHRELNNILGSLEFRQLENCTIYKGTDYSELDNRRVAENIIEMPISGSNDYFYKLIQILLIIEKRAIKCFLYKKEKEIKSDKYFVKLIRSILNEIDDRRKNLKSFYINPSDPVYNLVYFHYFSLFADISLMWGNVNSLGKKNTDKFYKFLKNKYILDSWTNGLENTYDIIAYTVKAERMIKTICNEDNGYTSQYVLDEINLLYDKLKDFEEKHNLYKNTHRHIVRAFCAIKVCKLYAITGNKVNLKELYFNIYKKNYCNSSYLDTLRVSLRESLQRAEQLDIQHSLQPEENKTAKHPKKISSILTRNDTDAIVNQCWKLFTRDIKNNRCILDGKYRDMLERAIVSLANRKTPIEQNEKISIKNGMKLLLYGFFFQFCEDHQTDKASLMADFIISTFKDVAEKDTFIHNWGKYRNRYKESSKNIRKL